MSTQKDTQQIILAAAVLLSEINPARLDSASGPGKSVYVSKRAVAALRDEFQKNAPEILETAYRLRNERKH